MLLVIVASLIPWQVVDRVDTGSMPWSVTVSADGGDAYVSHVGQKDRDVLRRYDAADLDVEARARFRGHAVESVLDGETLYVTNSRRHEVVALDAETLEVEARFRTGKIPKDLRLADGRLYVADYGGGTLSVIDLATGERTAVKVGKRPRGVALAPDGATVYVTNMGGGTVSVVDAASLEVTATWKACRRPRHAHATGDRVLVTCLGARAVRVLDAATGERLRTIEVGRGPKTIAVSPDGALAATADERSDTITLIDLDSYETATVSLDADGPCGAAFSPDGSRLYVTARGSDELLVLEPDAEVSRGRRGRDR